MSQNELVQQVEELAKTSATWADFSNALYDPISGILSQAFPDREQRKQFVQSSEFKKIQQIFVDTVERHGVLNGATPTKMTGFMTQLPPRKWIESAGTGFQVQSVPLNSEVST